MLKFILFRFFFHRVEIHIMKTNYVLAIVIACLLCGRLIVAWKKQIGRKSVPKDDRNRRLAASSGDPATVAYEYAMHTLDVGHVIYFEQVLDNEERETRISGFLNDTDSAFHRLRVKFLDIKATQNVYFLRRPEMGHSSIYYDTVTRSAELLDWGAFTVGYGKVYHALESEGRFSLLQRADSDQRTTFKRLASTDNKRYASVVFSPNGFVADGWYIKVTGDAVEERIQLTGVSRTQFCDDRTPGTLDTFTFHGSRVRCHLKSGAADCSHPEDGHLLKIFFRAFSRVYFPSSNSKLYIFYGLISPLTEQEFSKLLDHFGDDFDLSATSMIVEVEMNNDHQLRSSKIVDSVRNRGTVFEISLDK